MPKNDPKTCLHHFEYEDADTFGRDSYFIRCPLCDGVLFVYDEEEDMRRTFEPTVNGENVVALVRYRSRTVVYRRVDLSEKHIAWDVFISQANEVFAYKSPAERWAPIQPHMYESKDNRPQVNLARDNAWTGGGRYSHPYVYQLARLSGWIEGKRNAPLIRHQDEDITNSSHSNLCPGTHSQNAEDFAKHRRQGTLPSKKPVTVKITRETKNRLMQHYDIKGSAVGKKVEEIIRERLQADAVR